MISQEKRALFRNQRKREKRVAQGCGEGCGDTACRMVIEGAVQRLREEFVEKHRENQVEIGKIEDAQARLREELLKLRGRIDPYLDNGQPGLFSKMSAKLDTALEEIGKLRVDLGSDVGRRDAFGVVRSLVGPLIVGLLLVMAQHFWK